MSTLTAPHSYSARSPVRTPAWVGPAAVVAWCLVVQLVGSLATFPAVASGWYAGLEKPTWTPPDWVFGPVWAALYLMMAAAACLVWARRRDADTTAPLALFAAQLAANLAWSILFFGLHSPRLALFNILVLWVLVGTTAVAFARVSRWAGWLMAPYWLWVTFAVALNAAIVVING